MDIFLRHLCKCLRVFPLFSMPESLPSIVLTTPPGITLLAQDFLLAALVITVASVAGGSPSTRPVSTKCSPRSSWFTTSMFLSKISLTSPHGGSTCCRTCWSFSTYDEVFLRKSLLKDIPNEGQTNPLGTVLKTACVRHWRSVNRTQP